VALAAHEMQAAPEAPHSVFAVPAAQMPALQQPPLQSSVTEQVVVQAPVVVSHASSAAQSLATLHPHVPVARHAVPVLLATHETHEALAPHAA
jgi:hypothetical protein